VAGAATAPLPLHRLPEDRVVTSERCGVNALPHGSKAINKDGRTLVLCGHHVEEHRDALDKQKWTLLALANIETEPSKKGEPDGVHPEG
jgi:hypothetical protein